MFDDDTDPLADDSLYEPKRPATTVACYVLAGLSGVGGLILAFQTYAAMGDAATLTVFLVALAPALVSVVVLVTLGRIAEDVHLIRQSLNR